MGISESVTQTIFFVAAVVLATATAVMSYQAVNGMAGDLTAHADLMSQRLRSDLRLINDPAHVTANPLTLLVKNIGDQTLHPSLFTVLVDGTARTNLTIDVLDSADDQNLGAAQVASIVVNGLTLGSGDHTARVVAESGVSDELRFTV